jgi:hypothetical protein
VEIETHNQLRFPCRIEATRIIIRDRFGSPIAVFIELSNGHIRYFHINEEDFEQQLISMGLDRSLIVTRYKLKDLTPPEIR